MRSTEDFVRFCREIDEGTAQGFARAKRRGDFLGWLFGKRETKFLEVEGMARPKKIDQYIEAAANGESSPGMVLELAAELIKTRARVRAAEGIISGLLASSGQDLTQTVCQMAIEAAEKFVQADQKGRPDRD